MENLRVSFFDLNDKINVNKGYLKAIEEPTNETDNNKSQHFVIKPWHILSKILLYKLISLDENVNEKLKKEISLLKKKDDEEEWFDYINKNYKVPPSNIFQISTKIPFTIQHQCQSLYNYTNPIQILKVLYTPSYNGVASFISLDTVYINIWKGTNLYKRIKRDSNKYYMRIKEWIWIDKQRYVMAFTDNMKLLVMLI